jgi:hypothetical protein
LIYDSLADCLTDEHLALENYLIRSDPIDRLIAFDR